MEVDFDLEDSQFEKQIEEYLDENKDVDEDWEDEDFDEDMMSMMENLEERTTKFYQEQENDYDQDRAANRENGLDEYIKNSRNPNTVKKTTASMNKFK